MPGTRASDYREILDLPAVGPVYWNTVPPRMYSTRHQYDLNGHNRVVNPISGNSLRTVERFLHFGLVLRLRLNLLQQVLLLSRKFDSLQYQPICALEMEARRPQRKFSSAVVRANCEYPPMRLLVLASRVRLAGRTPCAILIFHSLRDPLRGPTFFEAHRGAGKPFNFVVS